MDVTVPVSLDVDALPSRRVTQLELVVNLHLRDPVSGMLEQVMGGVDASTGDWIRVPVPTRPADGGALDFRQLAPGGRKILFEDPTARSRRRLCLWDLHTDAAQWFDTDPETYGAVRASVSPDGKSIGTVVAASDPVDPYGDISLAAICLIDIAAGTSRRLFTASGGSGGDSGFAWSPDQRLMAATYTAAPNADHAEDLWATVVLDSAGDIRQQMMGNSFEVTLSPGGNAAWLDDRTLRCLYADELISIDIPSGKFTPVYGHLYVLARSGDRLIKNPGWSPPQPFRLVTVALDGKDERPWLEFPTRVPLGYEIDFA